ncbi:WD-40 repeat protein [Reticulomyxa filosa]|uniref:WD-40 repeat protein n=1 Tax=Reticulomyxa filosa TaxID=46433 RepID=X6P447_RETFI|nr:WD-40 repeat protein [Reticulomyxa filosa]|eukprot:ETO32859.1 WD-40 repeat protein [Reticulomyxa filosa]
MGNQNTTTLFQNLKDLPTPLSQSQCVLHKNEILICGGYLQRDFYLLYPNDVGLYGHCVVKLVHNNKYKNKITLLSFGGLYNHTLIMEYTSVWNNNNRPIDIGSYSENYFGARAVIGGSDNHLLFITHYNNISVFDLSTFELIENYTLPTDNNIYYHCFVLSPENKENNKLILFCRHTGLSIEYDEDRGFFQYDQLPVCDDIAKLYHYAYVRTNDAILFFGGWDGYEVVSDLVYKYSIRKKTWTTFEDTLRIPMNDCFVVLNEVSNYIHIIGGKIKLAIQHGIRVLKIKVGWANDLNKIIIKYVGGFELVKVLQGHYSIVNSVRFSADGRKVASASYDHTIQIWNAISGKQLHIFRGHTDQVFSVRFSPDGYTVVSCSRDETIRLWDINTGNEIKKIKKDSNIVYDVDFSPDGKYIVSGSQDNTIRLWDIHSGIEIKQLLGHSKAVLSIQFSPDGKMIVSSSNDKTICLWNVESGKMLKQYKEHANRIVRAKFSPDGRFIAFCPLDNTIRIWDIETETEWKVLEGHSNHVNDVKYFPDGKTIVSCSSDGTIQLWSVKSGRKIQKLKGPHSVRCVDISQDGSTICVYCEKLSKKNLITALLLNAIDIVFISLFKKLQQKIQKSVFLLFDAFYFTFCF